MDKRTDYLRIHSYLNGNRAAGEELCKETYVFLLKWVSPRVKLLGAPELAEDIVQKALTEVLPKIDQYNGSRPFSIWVLGFVKNYLKKAASQRFNLEYNQEILSENVFQHSPETRDPIENLLEQEEKELAVQVFYKLPDNYKAIIYRRIILGMKFKEISMETGATIDSLEHQYRRAIETARQIYNKINNGIKV